MMDIALHVLWEFVPRFFDFIFFVAKLMAIVLIVKTFVGAIMKLYEKIDMLNTNISDLNTKIEMLSIRTKMVKRADRQQSGIQHG